jgi:hypothetical protein
MPRGTDLSILPAARMIIRPDGDHIPAVTDPERFAFLLASAGG